MAYRKHIWRNGEVIKADLLNNMENGIYNEEARALEAEETLDQKIDSDVASVTNAIGVERTRATNAEAELTQSIEVESTRATTAENNLSSQITQESTRAQGAENNLRNYVDERLASAYKASGSIFFADLPALSESRRGNVYNIKDAFTTTSDFVEGSGKEYPIGTNVAIIEKDEESYEEATVTSTDNPSQMGLYELDGTNYVLTEDTAPVSGKTYYELVITPSYLYDVLAGFIDTSDFVTDTDYATTQTAGLVKPDGTTITVDANGVVSSQAGGDVSSEEMADVVNILGAKNYINSLNVDNNIDHATVKSLSDGVLHVYGAIDQEATIWDNSILISSTTMPDGDYILSDGINNDRSKISIFAAIEGTVVAMTHSTQYRNTFHLQGNDEVGFYVYGGQGFDDDIYVYPMCRPEHIEDETYVPYAKTNRQLTEDVETLQQTTFSDMTGATSSSDGTHGLAPAPLIADREKFLRGDGTWSGEIGDEISDIVNVLGAKNLLPNNASSQIVNGVTFTVNSDGSVSCSGTSTARSYITVYTGDALVDLIGEKIIVSGCPSGGDSVNGYDLSIVFFNNGTQVDRFYDVGEGLEIIVPTHDNVRIYIIAEVANIDMSNKTFYPMIRPISIKDDTYVPYAKTNLELTDGLKWKAFTPGGIAINGTANYPPKFNELYIVARQTGTGVLVPIFIPAILTKNDLQFRGGWSATANNSMTFIINTNANNLTFAFNRSGTDITTGVTVFIYYR